MTFEEYDGPQGGRVDACDADDEMPQDAIGRMGVGYIRPVEEPLMADREELCSTQVEPSSSQHQQAPSTEEDNDSSQRQDVDPHHDDHCDNSSQGELDSFSRMSSGAKAITQGRSVQTALRKDQIDARRALDQDQG